jgi:hypothetical protein
MKESTIEQKLRDAVRKQGGLCIKFISLSMTGLPDRIILLPGGRIGFAELKRKGLQPRPLQKAVMALLVRLGFCVAVIDSPEQITPFLQTVSK